MRLRAVGIVRRKEQVDKDMRKKQVAKVELNFLSLVITYMEIGCVSRGGPISSKFQYLKTCLEREPKVLSVLMSKN